MIEISREKVLVDAEIVRIEQLLTEQFLDMDGMTERAMGRAMRGTLRRLGLWTEKCPAADQSNAGHGKIIHMKYSMGRRK